MVNHVGFIVSNVQEQVAKWKAADVPVEGGNNGRLDQAYVDTPDGLRIEILENKNQPAPIHSEHVHFFLPEGAIPQSQARYAKVFGAKASQRNIAPVADIPGAQLRFAKAESAQAPTKGRILDHIGFDVKDLKACIKTLEANNIKLSRSMRAASASPSSLIRGEPTSKSTSGPRNRQSPCTKHGDLGLFCSAAPDRTLCSSVRKCLDDSVAGVPLWALAWTRLPRLARPAGPAGPQLIRASA